MMPMKEINIGDVYENPLLYPNGLMWIVVEKNDKDKMVKVQAVSSVNSKEVGKPIWKRNSDRMFSESWRTLNMANHKAGVI
jgi:hypothetical protein